MAEEYNCKPRELDEIISAEHQLLEKLRSSGLSDDDLLELVGSKNVDGDKPSDSVDSNAPYCNNEDDDISFYDQSGDDDD